MAEEGPAGFGRDGPHDKRSHRIANAAIFTKGVASFRSRLAAGSDEGARETAWT